MSFAYLWSVLLRTCYHHARSARTTSAAPLIKCPSSLSRLAPGNPISLFWISWHYLLLLIYHRPFYTCMLTFYLMKLLIMIYSMNYSLWNCSWSAISFLFTSTYHICLAPIGFDASWWPALVFIKFIWCSLAGDTCIPSRYRCWERRSSWSWREARYHKTSRNSLIANNYLLSFWLPDFSQSTVITPSIDQNVFSIHLLPLSRPC